MPIDTASAPLRAPRGRAGSVEAILRNSAVLLFVLFGFIAHLVQASSAFYDYCPSTPCCSHQADGDEHDAGGDGPDCACHWVTATEPLDCFFLPCFRTAIVTGIAEEPAGKLREAVRSIDHPPQLG